MGRDQGQGPKSEAQPSEPLPEITEEALVGAISMVLSGALADGPEDYGALRRQLVEFVLTPYLGAAQAARISAA